jgi:hypothetical protein
MRDDAYEEVRRVRPKIKGNPVNIAKLKRVDVIRKHPGRGYSLQQFFEKDL